MKNLTRLFVILLSLAVSEAVLAANFYITPSGAGAKTGADWNNALSGLPTSVSCGNSYFIAGGSYDVSGQAPEWDTDCNGNSTVSVYKAVDCSVTNAPYCGATNPATIAGWQARYGTSQAVFSQTASDLKNIDGSMLRICGGNYLVDGVTPLTGTPATSGFGIQLQSPNRVTIIGVATGCSQVPTSTVVGVTIKHIEFNGVNPNYGNNIVSCTRNGAGSTVTLVMQHDRANDYWLSGDPLDVWNTTPSGFNCGAPGCTINSISGLNIVIAQTGTPNETCSTPGFATLDYSPGVAIEAGGNKAIQDLTITDNYIHDVAGGAFVINNASNSDSERNWMARNHSTPTQHTNGIQATCYSTACGSPSIIANNIFEDIEGSGDIESLPGNATVNDLRVYNNVFFCSDGSGAVDTAASPQCGVSQTITDNNGYNPITNIKVYGNTFYNQHNCVTTGLSLISASSTGAVAENNLVYGSTCQSTFAGPGIVEDYNTVINNAGTIGVLAGRHDFNLTRKANPFVSTSSKNFRLSSETVDPHLNDGVILSSPYNLDLLGVTRGADGTWERGAFEFARPNPPTDVRATGH